MIVDCKRDFGIFLQNATVRPVIDDLFHALIVKMHKLGVGRRQKNQIRLSTSLQRIPQHIEVPPNIEVKQIVLYFLTVLSYSSDQLLLKDY